MSDNSSDSVTKNIEENKAQNDTHNENNISPRSITPKISTNIFEKSSQNSNSNNTNEWKCECGFNNIDRKDGDCKSCGKKRKSSLFSSSFTNIKESNENISNDKKESEEKINNKETTISENDNQSTPQNWNCACGFLNNENDKKCGDCEKIKPKFTMKLKENLTKEKRNSEDEGPPGFSIEKEKKEVKEKNEEVTPKKISIVINKDKVKSTNENDINDTSPKKEKISITTNKNTPPNSTPSNSTSDGTSTSISSTQEVRKDDWSCSCGFINFARRNECKSCGRFKPAVIVVTKVEPKKIENNGRDWTCKCGFVNFARRTYCKTCDKDRNGIPQQKSNNNSNNSNNNNNNNNNSNNSNNKKNNSNNSHVVVIKSTGRYWTCKCGFVNFAKRTQCKSCRKDRYGSSQNSNSNNQNNNNNNNNQEKRKEDTKKDWICGCGFVNFSRRIDCKSCNKERSKDALIVGSTEGAKSLEEIQKSNKSKPERNYIVSLTGEWKCRCGHFNLKKKEECVCCGRDKSGKLKDQQEDWMCLCGHVNFARRTECRVCKKIKANINASVKVVDKPEEEDEEEEVKKKVKKVKKPTPTVKVSPVDWMCVCGFENFAKRENCKNCYRTFEYVAKKKSIKKKIKKIDTKVEMGWKCKCGSVNKEVESFCNKCNESKPKDKEDGNMFNSLKD